MYLKDSLYDYLHSENRFEDKKDGSIVYGIATCDQLVHFLVLGQVDMRDYQALLHHKQVMYRRIKDYLKLSELAEEYRAVVDFAVRTHHSALKLTLTKQEKIKSIIERNLRDMRSLEVEILERVYEKTPLRKGKKNFQPPKTPLARPYTLDSKVRETLPDSEVWDILEEYVPGIRDSSQLPLVYGMRLKSIIGKGHYVGVTAEQEKEFLKRILALQPKE
jgi:hypothetical protein